MLFQGFVSLYKSTMILEVGANPWVAKMVWSSWRCRKGYRMRWKKRRLVEGKLSAAMWTGRGATGCRAGLWPGQQALHEEWAAAPARPVDCIALRSRNDIIMTTLCWTQWGKFQVCIWLQASRETVRTICAEEELCRSNSKAGCMLVWICSGIYAHNHNLSQVSKVTITEEAGGIGNTISCPPLLPDKGQDNSLLQYSSAVCCNFFPKAL